MNGQFQTIDQVKATAIDMVLKSGPKVLVASVIMIAGHFAASWAGQMVVRLVRPTDGGRC